MEYSEDKAVNEFTILMHELTGFYSICEYPKIRQK